MRKFLGKHPGRLLAVSIALSSVFIAISANAATVHADATTEPGLLFNQSAAYDAQVRANGETVVTARFDITNTTTAAISEISYTLDNQYTGSDVAAYQQLSTITCVSNKIYQYTYNYPNIPVPEPSKTCPASGQDAYYTYYPRTDVSYAKATAAISGRTIKVMLKNPVKADESTTVVLAYITTGGFTKSWDGVYHYTFKSLKSDKRFKNVAVSISGDVDMYLSDAAGRVNYVDTAPKSAGIASSLASGANLQSADTNSYIGSIGTSGIVQKTATNLAPNETVAVKGRFAFSTWHFHVMSYIVTAVIFVLFVAACVWWYRRKGRNDRNNPKGEETNNQQIVHHKPTDTSNDSSQTTIRSTGQVRQRYVLGIDVTRLPFYAIKTRYMARFYERRVRPVWFSLQSVILTVVLGFGVFMGYVALFSAENSSYFYSGIWENGVYIFAMIALAVIALLVVAVVLFAAPFLYALQILGKRSVVKILVWNIIWLVVVVIVSIVAVARLSQRSSSNGCGVPYAATGGVSTICD